MSEILTQEEIDSLLSAAAKGTVPTVAAATQVKRPFIRYDFRRPNRISKEQLQALQMLHGRFAKQMGGSLSPLLRTFVEIRPTLVEQIAYAEYIASVSYPACLGIFGMRPLKGGAIAELPPRLIFYIIDRILGGAGRIPDVARELTEIERALVSKLFRHTLEDLRSAWSRVDLFQFELLNLEVNPGFLQLAAPTDMVILIGFDVRIGEVEGVMNLCFPLSMLEPVLPSLSLRRWIAGHREEMDEGASGEIARAMPVVGLSVRALLGSIPLTVHELSRLNVGDIVRLDMGASSLGVLEVEGVPKYVVKVGTSRRKRAVQLVADMSEGRSTNGVHH
ncbi:MAG: flagellar motor switch protein FliM [Candidatus Methylomirabilota bacterium]|nr:flagellar motor switch protein FliM [candidate division NC10 bacterium]PWB43977.1 MAG: flagellar motor switch protein FliM [candidate division NC10 bacterium]